MPHQRKYVAHSGGIEACPSRAKRWISAYASHGFSSRLRRSARCAFVSLTASVIAPPRSRKRESRAPLRRPYPGSKAHSTQRPHPLGRPPCSSKYTLSIEIVNYMGGRAETLDSGGIQRGGDVAPGPTPSDVDPACREARRQTG